MRNSAVQMASQSWQAGSEQGEFAYSHQCTAPDSNPSAISQGSASGLSCANQLANAGLRVNDIQCGPLPACSLLWSRQPEPQILAIY